MEEIFVIKSRISFQNNCKILLKIAEICVVSMVFIHHSLVLLHPVHVSWSVIPVLRGHLWQKEKWPYKTCDLLKEVKFIWNFLWEDRKRWPVNTGDCLIEVTARTCLTVHIYNVHESGTKKCTRKLLFVLKQLLFLWHIYAVPSPHD